MATSDPITGICIVDKKNCCPPGYVLIDRTSEGEDSDLWKDGLFRSKVTRYICYTKAITAGQWNHIVTNICLIGLKDAVPAGYSAIRVTVDTKEQALRKHILCVQLLPKTTTNAGVTDLKLMRSDKYRMEQLTLVGEVNGLNIVYKLTSIPRRMVPPPSRPAPAPPIAMETSTPLSAPPPVPRRPRESSVTSTQSTHHTHDPLAGIEFKLHERLSKRNTNSTDQDNINITIKSQAELDELFGYDFSVERKVMM